MHVFGLRGKLECLEETHGCMRRTYKLNIDGYLRAVQTTAPVLGCTFLLSDEVLDNDISHVVSIGIAILVEAVNCAKYDLVAGNGPILAAQHLDKI